MRFFSIQKDTPPQTFRACTDAADVRGLEMIRQSTDRNWLYKAQPSV